MAAGNTGWKEKVMVSVTVTCTGRASSSVLLNNFITLLETFSALNDEVAGPKMDILVVLRVIAGENGGCKG